VYLLIVREYFSILCAEISILSLFLHPATIASNAPPVIVRYAMLACGRRCCGETAAFSAGATFFAAVGAGADAGADLIADFGAGLSLAAGALAALGSLTFSLAIDAMET